MSSSKQSMKLNSRSRYWFTIADILYSVLWPLKCITLRCCKCLKTLNERYRVFSRGRHKLDKELSVVAFVKMQRKLKMLVRLLLTKQQRTLTSYSKLSKISVSSASDGSCSDSSASQRLPKMLDSSKARQEHNEAVSKFFDEYTQQKLTLNDYKLLHEVFTNKEPEIEILKNNDVDYNNYWNQTINQINDL